MMESALQHQEGQGKIAPELSDVQVELPLSRSPGAEREQEILCKEADIQELNSKFDRLKASHSDLRDDLTAMEGLISVLDEELRAKNESLEQISSRLQREARRRETVEEHNTELQKLVQESHSKAEDSIKKASELEMLLETSEKELIITSRKLKDALAEKEQCSIRLSELSSELDAFYVRSSSLETALQAANDNERELMDILTRVTLEKRKVEESAEISERKLEEAERLIEILQLQLQSITDLQNSTEKDKEAGLSMEKLWSREEVPILHLDYENESETVKEVQLDESSNRLTARTELISRKPSPDNETLCDAEYMLKGEVASYQVKVDPCSAVWLSVNPEKDSYAEESERSREARTNDKPKYFQNHKARSDESLEKTLGEEKSKEIQLECLNEVLERENLKLAIDLAVCETKANDLLEVLSTVLRQGKKARAELQHSRREAMTQTEENLIDPGKEARKLSLSVREVEGIRAGLGEKEAELARKVEENESMVEELAHLRRELHIAHDKLAEKHRRQMLESHSKNGVEFEFRDVLPPGEEPSKTKDNDRNLGSLRLSQRDRTSSVSLVEEPIAFMNFKCIMGMILASIILGIILGKRF